MHVKFPDPEEVLLPLLAKEVAAVEGVPAAAVTLLKKSVNTTILVREPNRMR